MSKCRRIANRGNCARLHCNISSAKEYLLFVLDVSEFILSNIMNFKEEELATSNINLEDVVLCNKRIFCFVSKDKYFSVNYPMEVNENATLIHLGNSRVDLMSISNIKGAIDDLFNGFQKNNITLEESNKNSSTVLSKNELRFVEQVLSLEHGYLRYDYDKDNENGRFHPLNHLDLNYYTGKFKIGLYGRLAPYEFMTILGCIPKEECAFIESMFRKLFIKLFGKITSYVNSCLYNLISKYGK